MLVNADQSVSRGMLCHARDIIISFFFKESVDEWKVSTKSNDYHGHAIINLRNIVTHCYFV